MREGEREGSTAAAEGKGNAKVTIKGKYFHCNVDGHWKKNCPKYLTKKKEKEGDCSRYGYLYLMEHKFEALEKFKKYKSEVENLLMWELVDLPERMKPVGANGSIREREIQLGRILLSIATFYDYEIWQMDVKTTFLKGNLEEYLYVSTQRVHNPRSIGKSLQAE
ncbi:gag/pol protein [Cucumis melo var. makuwa]|uniref:Gag/pol protein n=1 Tax=Cucumis melo var. makuwa TaxID=1194695 RepID=A0A5A7UB08_CUCMM|nr:gag/pol protein [Cucumis melo var. makuwa]